VCTTGRRRRILDLREQLDIREASWQEEKGSLGQRLWNPDLYGLQKLQC
jgi:hypothetical protein